MGKESLVFVGNYSAGDDSAGIHILRMDADTGALDPLMVAGGIENPSFLAIAPDGRRLYAAIEVPNFTERRAGVAAFEIDRETGGLAPLNRQETGGAPCYLSVDSAGRHLAVANYFGGSAALLPIAPSGRLGPPSDSRVHKGHSIVAGRQDGPHPHAIVFDPQGRFVHVPDLGLDRVLSYPFDPASGRLGDDDPHALEVPPGAGPRHLVFAPDGRHAYLVTELDSTVIVCAYDATAGRLTILERHSTLPAGFEARSHAADIRLHPTGRMLYASNRGHDSLALFAVDPESGRLTPAGHVPAGGRVPRGFGIAPGGRLLLAANQGSDRVASFAIEPGTLVPRPTGHAVSIPRPSFVAFLGAD